jgi:hypothetical protein
MFGTLTGEVIGAMNGEDRGTIEAEFEVLPEKPVHDHGNATGSACIPGEPACDFFINANKPQCDGVCGGDCGRCAGGYVDAEDSPIGHEGSDD